ncbi:CopD family protein [Rhodoferax sp.]|uniref:CopD family protein n=1 Tax=Rhodoferax sp. TaxID=50421 RepID=UPI00262A480A|nr:CopD family protein [Rhodoferax sp.]MDD2925192.1 CopD family protein [Rhodoferax sp.]
MLFSVLKTLHLLAVIVWVGGMVFAHFFLRPALAQLDPAGRLRLMHGVLGRFFVAVLVAASVALVTGSWMIGQIASQTAQAGGRFIMPVSWMVMAALGGVMALVFAYIRMVLFRRLDRAVTAANWPAGAAALASIRQWVLVNLTLGVVIVLVTLLGPAR